MHEEFAYMPVLLRRKSGNLYETTISLQRNYLEHFDIDSKLKNCTNLFTSHIRYST